MNLKKDYQYSEASPLGCVYLSLLGLELPILVLRLTPAPTQTLAWFSSRAEIVCVRGGARPDSGLSATRSARALTCTCAKQFSTDCASFSFRWHVSVCVLLAAVGFSNRIVNCHIFVLALLAARMYKSVAAWDLGCWY